MKQGTKVRWVDGMGIENKGIVDWESTQWDTDTVPIRDEKGVIRWITRELLEKEMI